MFSLCLLVEIAFISQVILLLGLTSVEVSSEEWMLSSLELWNRSVENMDFDGGISYANAVGKLQVFSDSTATGSIGFALGITQRELQSDRMCRPAQLVIAQAYGDNAVPTVLSSQLTYVKWGAELF